jgi:hypothetical protein
MEISMKKFAALGFVIFVCLMSAACSFSVNCVVVNESDSEIELEYVLSLENYVILPETKMPSENFIPAKMDLSVWESRFSGEDWVKMSETEYQFDLKTGRLKLKIAPQQAVKILQTDSGALFESNYKRFQITQLEIDGANGKAAFEGAQLVRQFTRRNNANHFIAYK